MNPITRLFRAQVRLSALVALVLVGGTAWGAEQTPADDDVRALAERIDRHIAARWQKEGVTPAPVADDAEFLRRAYLQIAGTLPPVSEAREFLDDPSPDKRRALVDRLLAGSGYITNFTHFWRSVMLPETKADLQARVVIPGFEAWLREKLIANTDYDDLVRDLLTAPVEAAANGGRTSEERSKPTPIGFYQAKQAMPANLAGATSRVFLGVRLECAQCHDHPFDKWKQEQFWELAAFFAGMNQPAEGFPPPIQEAPKKREITIPDTDTVVEASFLDGKEPQWNEQQSSRETLAAWITSPENPYFARMAVNRLWGHFFGVGIVEPVDDFGLGTAPSHPELLGELARKFAAHEFDQKFLIRAITASRTYQLTSRKTHESQEHPQLFARFAVQGMTPEQLFESLSTAVGYYQPFQIQNGMAMGNGGPAAEFSELFSNDSDTATTQTTTILQALAMMNGEFIASATDLSQSSTLAAVIEFPLLSTREQIETLYLAALTRRPRAEELERLTAYVESGGPTEDPEQALGDVFWALLNSSEFLFVH